MNRLQVLIDKNHQWAERAEKEDPDFFDKHSISQSPEYLWIGCSDSRVAANVIVDLLPGELFVHRNVANLVVNTDLNCLSVIQYAVEILKVKHIIICGHYGCGGIKSTLNRSRHGLIDNWLSHVHYTYRKYEPFFAGIRNEQDRFDRLSELNVIEQVSNICQTTILKDAWHHEHNLTVHGWIYRLSDGRVNDLETSIGFNDNAGLILKNATELILKKRMI